MKLGCFISVNMLRIPIVMEEDNTEENHRNTEKLLKDSLVTG